MASGLSGLAQRIGQLACSVILVCIGLTTLPAHAHEMGMAVLDITETAPGRGHLAFKRTKASDGRLAALDFTLQPNCSIKPLAIDNDHPNEVIQSAVFSCASNQPLAQVSATGFARLAPELVVKIQRDGLTEHGVLTPERPSLNVGMPQQKAWFSEGDCCCCCGDGIWGMLLLLLLLLLLC